MSARPSFPFAAIPLLIVVATPSAADNPPPLLWEHPLSAPSFGSAAIGDIDGDGRPEVVFGTYFGDEHAYALNGEDGSLLWRFDVGGGPLDASAAIYDVDGDGQLEVLVAASWGILFCLDGNGDEEWRFPSVGYVESIDSPPGVADLDGDGRPEVVFGAWGGMVYALHGEDGSLYWERPLGADDYIQTQPAILDVDGDLQLDVVVASFSDASRVWALRGNDGEPIWEITTGDWMYHGPSFADIDEDGLPELAISCYDGKLYVLNAEDGSEAWSYPTSSFWPLYSPVALADLDRDGHLELAAAGNDVFVLSHTGELEWSYPTGGSVFRGPTVSDVDGDGWLDLAFGSSDATLRVVRGVDGSEIWTWELGGTNEIDHAVTFADLDLDGDLDLFFVAGYGRWPPDDNHGTAYAVDTGVGPAAGCAGDGPVWPMFALDHRHSGHFRLEQATLYRSPVQVLAAGWRESSLPLTSLNDVEDGSFPRASSLGGSSEDTDGLAEPLTLYRLLGADDAACDNRLRVAKSAAGVVLSY